MRQEIEDFGKSNAKYQEILTVLMKETKAMILLKIKEIEDDITIKSKQKMWLKTPVSDPTLVKYFKGVDGLGSNGFKFWQVRSGFNVSLRSSLVATS